MPMFEPPCKRGGVKGQILDLDTAVKGGVLGGGVDSEVVGTGVGEKLDLGKMIEELDLCEVPSVFICPISLEPMQDPVTLCTGQTYERCNVLKWSSLGHFTCPTTMQELWDGSLTPNTTLHRFITTWFSQKYLVMKKKSEDVQGRVLEIVETLKKVKGQARVSAFGAVSQLVELLSALEHECLELALSILDALASVPEGRLALKDCSNTIPVMVKLLMRVSENCTQYALSILWSVCNLATDECSLIDVEAGLSAKLLLVIQSGCNPILKQQSAELLKLCSLNYSDTTFISKCKLTRTIQ